MADLTQDSLEVVVGEETFFFRIPVPREYARVDSRAHEMRRQDAPSTGGSNYGLDPFAQDIYRGIALLEILLVRADAKDNWPWSNDKDGKPVIDQTKFPPAATKVIPQLSQGFEVAYGRFLDGGPGNNKPSGEAPVGGQPGDP